MAAKKVKNQSTSTLSLMCGPLVQKAVRRLWQKQSFIISFFFYIEDCIIRRCLYTLSFHYNWVLNCFYLLCLICTWWCVCWVNLKKENISADLDIWIINKQCPEIPLTWCVLHFFFFNHVLSYSLLNALYLCVVLTCRLQGCH